jgi:uncharacterized phage protein (TIGR01671 family)
MREILFRGKSNGDGEWITGFLVSPSHIGDWVNAHPIDPKTVGQFTGLTDKNGKKIFEGDIVRGRHWTSYNDKNPEDFHLWRVDWGEKSGLITFVDSPTTKARMSIHDFADFGEVEVIGNIHDNPELLTKEDNHGKT